MKNLIIILLVSAFGFYQLKEQAIKSKINKEIKKNINIDHKWRIKNTQYHIEDDSQCLEISSTIELILIKNCYLPRKSFVYNLKETFQKNPEIYEKEFCLDFDEVKSFLYKKNQEVVQRIGEKQCIIPNPMGGCLKYTVFTKEDAEKEIGLNKELYSRLRLVPENLIKKGKRAFLKREIQVCDSTLSMIMEYISQWK